MFKTLMWLVITSSPGVGRLSIFFIASISISKMEVSKMAVDWNYAQLVSLIAALGFSTICIRKETKKENIVKQFLYSICTYILCTLIMYVFAKKYLEISAVVIGAGYSLYIYARAYIFYNKKLYPALFFEFFIYAGSAALLTSRLSYNWVSVYFLISCFAYAYYSIFVILERKETFKKEDSFWEGFNVGALNLLSSGFIFLIPLMMSIGADNQAGVYTLAISMASLALLFPRAYFNYKIKEITFLDEKSIKYSQRVVFCISTLSVFLSLLIIYIYFYFFWDGTISKVQVITFVLICSYLFIGQISLIYMHIVSISGKSKNLLVINFVGLAISIVVFYAVFSILGDTTASMLGCLSVYSIYYLIRFFFVKKQALESVSAFTVSKH